MGKRAIFITFAAAGVLILLGAAGWQIMASTAERIVVEQSERTSVAWANYIGDRLERIEDIAKGAEISEDERQFLSDVRQFGDIFRFKLFDTQGQIRLISDTLYDPAKDPESGGPNPTATKVAETGMPHSEMHDGTGKADRPDIYIETYTPVVRGERIVAVAEVYVDRTKEAAIVRAEFSAFGFKVVILTLLALMLPGAGMIWMNNRLKNQNLTLIAERLRAQEAERSKARFLAHMSHEFRTPLNSIQGLTQVLLRGDLGKLENAKHREYVQDVFNSGEHLLSLVNDVLDLSKIDFGKYDLTESEFDLGKCVNGALQVVRGWEAVGDLIIRTHGLTEGIFVRADRRAIYQSVLNLLSNAVKFTRPSGSIDITVGKDETGRPTITVKDTGIGIPERDLDKVFEPFTERSNRDYVASQPGTGLGLALVKSLTELHGGSVSIESEPGEGTTVRIHLPVDRLVTLPGQGKA